MTLPSKVGRSLFAAAIGLMLGFNPAFAGSATWLANPASNDWNTATNWTVGGPPNGPGDTATFQSSVLKDLTISAFTRVNSIAFGMGGVPSYTITVPPNLALILDGSGITNNSGITQAFVTTIDQKGHIGLIDFANSATAGVLTSFTNYGSPAEGTFGSVTQFRNDSSADRGTFINEPRRTSLSGGGLTLFFDSSNAGNGVFLNKNGGGVTEFHDNSTAANGTFTNRGAAIGPEGGGGTVFYDSSSAGNGIFTNKGPTSTDWGGAGSGNTSFYDNSTAANGLFISEGAVFGLGGFTMFWDDSTAGQGTFVAHGGNYSGHISFSYNSSADHGLFYIYGGPELNNVGGEITFYGGGTTAGHGTFFVYAGVPGSHEGTMNFYGNSTAANGTFTNDGGLIRFYDTSTAGSGTFVTSRHGIIHCGNAGDATFITYGATNSFDLASEVHAGSANNATFITNGGTVSGARGATVYLGGTTGNATLVANGGVDGGLGGSIRLYNFTNAARAQVLGNGYLSLNTGNSTIGSLEGNGAVFLGTNQLSVGSNNLSTSFSGSLKDGTPTGGGGTGSLTKIGPGTLILSGSNTYTGATTINGGKLTVDGSITSAVAVNNSGSLGGSGATGSVTVNSGGIVAPGNPLHINGNYAQNAGGVLKVAIAGTDPGAYNHIDIAGSATLDGTLEVRFGSGFLPASGQVFKLLNVAGAFAGSFTQIVFPNLKPGFQFQAEFVNGSYQITALNDGVAANPLLNISTRMRVGTDDNALIGGFIVTGNAAKRVIIRAIGPSLTTSGSPLPGRLADPTLELRDNTGGLIFSNDNWVDSPQRQQIIDSGLSPSHDHEAAIVATLNPGSYTAIMRGANTTTGIGVVEVYDLAQDVSASLANISSRGLVETGDNVMIGGFIVGNQPLQLIVRAIGPSLTQFGIANALADPILTLYNSNGTVMAFNNDWQDNDSAVIAATGIPPAHVNESAIVATLAPGPCTAIVRGLNDTTGVGLVEVYGLQ